MAKSKIDNNSGFFAYAFQTDKKGRNVFFPWGKLGKGYVVEDSNQKNKLASFYSRFCTFGFVGALVLVQGKFSWPIIIGSFFLFYVVYAVVLGSQIKGLAVSDKDYSVLQTYKTMGKSFGFSSGGVWILLVLFGVVFSLCVFFTITQPQDASNSAFYLITAIAGLGIILSIGYLVKKRSESIKKNS
jgi:hypothetical protein